MTFHRFRTLDVELIEDRYLPSSVMPAAPVPRPPLSAEVRQLVPPAESAAIRHDFGIFVDQFLAASGNKWAAGGDGPRGVTPQGAHAAPLNSGMVAGQFPGIHLLPAVAYGPGYEQEPDSHGSPVSDFSPADGHSFFVAAIHELEVATKLTVTPAVVRATVTAVVDQITARSGEPTAPPVETPRAIPQAVAANTAPVVRTVAPLNSWPTAIRDRGQQAPTGLEAGQLGVFAVLAPGGSLAAPAVPPSVGGPVGDVAAADPPPDVSPPEVAPPPAVIPVMPASAADLPGVFPLAGLLPLDLASLEVGAHALFAHLSDLGPEAPDAVSDAEDYTWLTAAGFLAGGLVYTVRVNRMRARADRVTTGADSVLARWEEKNAGGTR